MSSALRRLGSIGCCWVVQACGQVDRDGDQFDWRGEEVTECHPVTWFCSGHEKRVKVAAVGQVVGWMVAVGRRVLPAQRKQPFDLQLPVISGLAESDTESEQPTEVVFALEQDSGELKTGCQTPKDQ